MNCRHCAEPVFLKPDHREGFTCPRCGKTQEPPPPEGSRDDGAGLFEILITPRLILAAALSLVLMAVGIVTGNDGWICAGAMVPFFLMGLPLSFSIDNATACAWLRYAVLQPLVFEAGRYCQIAAVGRTYSNFGDGLLLGLYAASLMAVGVVSGHLGLFLANWQERRRERTQDHD